MQNIIVTNKQPRLVCIGIVKSRGADGTVNQEQVRLKPGANEVSADRWAKCLESAQVKEMVADKRLEVEGKPVDQDASPLTALDVNDAKALIGKTLDANLLEVWGRDEKRRPVITAITEQVKKVSKAA